MCVTNEGKIIYDAKTGLPVRPSTETYQGNAYADWKGGWMNNFTYKGWNVGITLDGSFGGKLIFTIVRINDGTRTFKRIVTGAKMVLL